MPNAIGSKHTIMNLKGLSDTNGDQLEFDLIRKDNESGHLGTVYRIQRDVDDHDIANPTTETGQFGYVEFGDNENYMLAFGRGYNTEFARFDNDGDFGIGTETIPSGYKLAVNGNGVFKGTVRVEELICEDVNLTSVPDYVFEKEYKLKSLVEIEAYVKKHKHLEEIPSAKEIVENGLDLKEMNLLLLKKVEEMTLHMIEMKKEIEGLKAK